MRRVFLAALEKAEGFFSAVGSLLLFVIAMWTLLDISTRTILGKAVGGSYETTGVVMVIIVFLGLAGVEAKDRHIKIPIIVDALPPKIGNSVNALVALVGIIVFLIIGKEIAGWAVRAWQQKWTTMGLIPVPLWPAYAAMVLGSFLMILRLLVRSIYFLKLSPPTLDELSKTESQRSIQIKSGVNNGH